MTRLLTDGEILSSEYAINKDKGCYMLQYPGWWLTAMLESQDAKTSAAWVEYIKGKREEIGNIIDPYVDSSFTAEIVDAIIKGLTEHVPMHDTDANKSIQ